MKSSKRHLTDVIELPNQDRIRTLAENETYKYFGISGADTINQVEMKDKIKKKNISGELKTTQDKTLLQKPYQVNKYLSCTTRQIFRTLSHVDQRRIQTNGP